MSFGLKHGFAVELHGHVGKEGGASLRHESKALALHYQVAPCASTPWRFGFSAEYEKARSGGAQTGSHAEEPAGGEHHNALRPRHGGVDHGDGGGDNGHDDSDTATGGLRGHGGNRLVGRFIMARGWGKSNLALNLIGARERGHGMDWGYAVAFRPNITRRFGLGVEAQGQFESNGVHEVLIGLYGEPTERLTLKLGVGKGIGHNSSDFTLRTGVVWRFR